MRRARRLHRFKFTASPEYLMEAGVTYNDEREAYFLDLANKVLDIMTDTAYHTDAKFDIVTVRFSKTTVNHSITVILSGDEMLESITNEAVEAVKSSITGGGLY